MSIYLLKRVWYSIYPKTIVTLIVCDKMTTKYKNIYIFLNIKFQVDKNVIFWLQFMVRDHLPRLTNLLCKYLNLNKKQ